ncbi:MAG: tetratricopeptide repeat protein [Candidatus Electrothrix aestuarii]|uniref:Tetratricopeptide repeat protein n=1 Tax=Candidatus Electrothrix aestuarii TaxID=3062594 RepID=A0AAU8LWR2_9BACT|nr:tetratricopeptide repeat protein [Candidatus Electrothrix aestuarii]
MFFIDPTTEQGLQASDGLILEQAFLIELEEILPVPASVVFWLHDDPTCLATQTFSPEQQERLQTWQSNRGEDSTHTPVVLTDLLVIPLLAGTQQELTLVIHDVDPALLRKMDSEWLLELQEKIIHHFCHIRQIYTDSESGLYNSRALSLFLTTKLCKKTLFLIATVPGTRSLASGFQKNRQVTTLLQSFIEGPLFSLGHGLFAAVRSTTQRNACLEYSHRLISRLKREGLRRVHIVFSSLPSEETPQEILATCQLLLAEAERRGPYSLCDEAFLSRKEQHPFALPAPPVIRELQKTWHKLEQFGILLVSFAQEPPEDISSVLTRDCSCHALNERETLILLPKLSLKQTSQQVKQLSQNIREQLGLLPSIGFCHWPTVAVTKLETVRACRKAILHASFYAQGAVVAFDALSYNVSGDHYFDEGDYKQAIREYRAGLQLQANDVNLLNSLGVALTEINRHREAEICFTQVLDQEPQNSMALINKGMCARLLGRSEEAITCFEQGLYYDSKRQQATLELYLQLGKLYCLKEEFAKAVTLLDEWRRLHGEPGEFVFFRLFGEAALGAGKYQDAMKALQRSLQIYPQNTDSQSMLGLLYVLDNQGAEVGLSLCSRAIKADRGDARHLYRRAAALHHLGRLQEALHDVQDSLQIQRNNEQTLLLRAILYEELGSLRRAQQGFQRIVSMKKSTEKRKKEALAGLARIAARLRISSQS